MAGLAAFFAGLTLLPLEGLTLLPLTGLTLLPFAGLFDGLFSMDFLIPVGFEVAVAFGFFAAAGFAAGLATGLAAGLAAGLVAGAGAAAGAFSCIKMTCQRTGLDQIASHRRRFRKKKPE